MRISSSNVGMESARRYTSESKRTAMFARYTVEGSLNAESGQSGISAFRDLIRGNSGKEEEAEGTEKKKNSEENIGDSLFNLQNSFSGISGIKKVSSISDMEMFDRIRQQCINYLIQLFYPQKAGTIDETGVDYNLQDSEAGMGMSSSSTLLLGNISTSYSESENTSFQTTGSVVTADGRNLSFNLEMEMSRSFSSTFEQNYEMLYRNVDVCDPLVINLDGNIADVSDQKFTFDIDADGILDRVSMLNSGSGYLALDKNEDGQINDGSELFGPQSGNGFKDLSAYDEDGNGWIDENDKIWNKLLIWTKDENGKDQLYHLSDKGVGAICLQNQATDFSMKSMRDNQLNGMVRSTGIFLYENGQAGTIQHLDLAK